MPILRLNSIKNMFYHVIVHIHKGQEAKKILKMASSTVKKDKKLILTKTIIVNIVLSDGKNKKESKYNHKLQVYRSQNRVEAE